MHSANEDVTGAVEKPVEKPIERPLPLWLNRDFMLLWSGQTISMLGGGISQIAFPLLVLALTGSPAQAGFAGAFRTLPYLLLSLPAGALIDRWDRKRVMIFCDVGRGLSLASIPIALALGHLTVLQLYLTALIEGILFVFFNIAEAASLPRVVTPKQLPSATAQYEATFSLSSLLGPPLGGAFYGIGQAFPFLADAISYSASVLSLLFIKATFQEERTEAPGKLREEIKEGLLWLWRQPLIRILALLTGGSNLLFAGSALIVIVLAQRLGAAPAIIGIIFAIEGLGGVIGSLLASFLQKKLRFGTVVMGTFWISALLWPFYAVASNVFLLGAIAAVLFFVGPIYNVVQYSYRLTLIPDELQGRVNSVFRLIALGADPLGLALTGMLLQWFTVVPTVLILGLGLLVLAVASLNKHIREARSITED